MSPTDRVSKRFNVDDELRRLAAVIEMFADPVYVVIVEPELAFRFALLNEALVKQSGRSRTDVIGRRPDEVFPFGQAAAMVDRLKLAANEGHPIRYAVKADNTQGPQTIDVTLSPINDSDGRCVLLVGVARGIEHSAYQDQRWSSLTHHTVEGIAVVGPDLLVTEMLLGELETWGCDGDSAIGLDFRKLFHPDDEAIVAEVFRLVNATPGETTSFEARSRHQDGHWRWSTGTARNLQDHPDIEGVVFSINDRLERTESQNRVQEVERRFRGLVKNAPDAVIGVDMEQQIVVWNKAAAEMFGYERHEIIGRPLATLLPAESRPRHGDLVRTFVDQEVDRRTMQTGPTINAIRRNGDRFPVEVGLAKVPVEDGQMLMATVRDITDRARSEEASMRVHDQLEAVMRVIPDTICRVATDGTLLEIMAGSDGGLLPQSLTGQSLANLLPRDLWERVETDIAKSIAGGAPTVMKFDESEAGIDGGRSFEARHVPLGEDEIVAVIRDITEQAAAEMDAYRQRERYEALVANTFDSISIRDADTRITYIQAMPGGLSRDDMLGGRIDDLLHPDHRPEWDTAWQGLLDGGPGATAEITVRFRFPEGYRWLEVRLRNQLDNPAVEGMVLNSRDVTERIRADERVRQAGARYESLIQNSSDAILVVEDGGLVNHASGSVETIFGMSINSIVGKPIMNVARHLHADDFDRTMQAGSAVTDDPSGLATIQTRVQHGDGGWRWVELVLRDLRHDEAVEGVVINVRDISDRKAAEAQLEHQALHDPLTGLPNRSLLSDRLDHALSRTSRQGGIVGLLFLDLDKFKHINDSHGHDVGDRLLVAVADRIQAMVRDSDTVARVGGDEFVVLAEDLENVDELFTLAERIIESFRVAVSTGVELLHTTASVGLAVATDGDSDVTTVLRNADAAMYQAKEGGRNRIEVFDTALQARLEHRLDTEAALRAGLMKGEFTLHYQPIMELGSLAVTGVEALVRWEHPTRGLIAPDEFIPIAEDSGLIVELGAWVLHAACRQIVSWQHRLGVDLEIAVNISARQLVSPGLAKTVTEVIERTGIAPDQLCLEVTETALIDQPEIAIANLESLLELGIDIALDDFGTGHASLTYLRTLPITHIKIDRSFTAGLGSNPSDTTITEFTIALAHGLELQVIAEGIETQTQLDLLKHMNCDLGQGYHLGRPLAPHQLEADLETSSPLSRIWRQKASPTTT